ncbi:MAG: hypothetical protein SA378_03330 [Sedimentibacter sp.]|uniref:hypothetical protein n=1 Tax=Sedimentibacter sp. TaxID=1960295 RepID=UPI002981AB48|nr:hypothetical protein [Sedimentibacter sp.]MDW5299158.1 hypothetical protein [Sedimentibacter sp.]
MDPLGILYGVLTYAGASTLFMNIKKPMKKVAVLATSQMFGAIDSVKEATYNIKEGFEDIIAEAHYENMKRNQNLQKESMDSDIEEGGI